MTTGTNTTLLKKLVTKAILPSPACEHARKVYHDIKALAVLGLYVRPRVTYFPPSEELESGYESTETQVAKIRANSDMLASEWINQYHDALTIRRSIFEVRSALSQKRYTILKSKLKGLNENETAAITMFINATFSDLSLLIVSQTHAQEEQFKLGEIQTIFAVVGMDGIITIFEIGKTKDKTILKLKPI